MKHLLLLTAVFFCGLQVIKAQQPGDLDPSFGNNGIVTANFGSPYNYNYKFMGRQVLLQSDEKIYVLVESDLQLAFIVKIFPDGSLDSNYGNNGFSDSVKMVESHAEIQPDGKIVLIGMNVYYNYNKYNDGIIARYNTQGKLDSSFDTDGKKAIDYIPSALAIRSDGKIIVVGGKLVCYNTDGSVDDTFNSDPLPLQWPTDLAIQNDGRMVVTGRINQGGINDDFAVVRYNDDGSLDSTFSSDGKQFTDFESSFDAATALALQKDGKILLAGYTGNALGFVRYNIDGSLDSSFGNNGKQKNLTSIVTSSIAIQSDGKIVVAGNGYGSQFIVERYNADGTPDNTFSGDGRQETDFGFPAASSTVAIQTDGKIIVAGNASGIASSYGPYFIIVRYAPNGNLDNSFDEDGKLTSQSHFKEGSTFYKSTTAQTDGKIIAAGYTWNGSNYDFIITRYNTDGTLDNTFNQDGNQIKDFGANDYANSVAMQIDGKIIIAGYSQINNNSSTFVLIRFNINGSIDSTFSEDGIQQNGFLITAIAIQNNGKILVSGASGGKHSDFAIIRYNSDGSLDSSFSGDGKLTTDFSFDDVNLDDVANSITIQNDGKIVAVGPSVYNLGKGYYEYYHSLARYNYDGSLDLTFSEDGKQTTLDISNDNANTVVIQSDKKILVGGSSGREGNLVFKRYNTDGNLDNTFGDNGTQVVDIKGSSKSLALQADGKILSSVVPTIEEQTLFTIVRLNTNGSLDNTFNGSGIQITDVTRVGGIVEDIVIVNNKLYAVGSGNNIGNVGVVARYFLDDETATPPTANLTNPAHDTTYIGPLDIKLAATATDADGSISKVELYNGETLLRTENSPPYSWLWKDVPVGEYTITAKAYDNDGLVTTSSPVHITVAANKAPTVNIITPADNQTFTEPANIHLEAIAKDPDGAINKVDFYNGEILLVTERKVPYTFNWKNVPTGDYIITARATDSYGEETISAVVHISVVSNIAPSVSIVNPANEESFTAPAAINIKAIAKDPDGKISKVEFYEGARLLRTERYAGYSWKWKDVPAGTYTITAKATDNLGAETISSPVTVIVESPETPLLARGRISETLDKANISAAISLKLSPNPAHNILNITTEGIERNRQTTMSLISSSGTILKTMRSNKSIQPLDVSALAKGVYTIRILSGDKVIYRKFVKL